MRELVSKRPDGDEVRIRVRANALARLYFHEAFQANIDEKLQEYMRPATDNIQQLLQGKALTEGDLKLLSSDPLAGMEKLGIGLDQLIASNQRRQDPLETMRIIYVMNRAQLKAENNADMPDFRRWIEKYAEFNVLDCEDDFLEEIQEGFFRLRSAQPGA